MVLNYLRVPSEFFTLDPIFLFIVCKWVMDFKFGSVLSESAADRSYDMGCNVILWDNFAQPKCLF